MPASFSMPKLDREIESVNVFFFLAEDFHLSFCCPSSFFLKDEDDPLFFGKWVIGFRNGREEGALFSHQPFFLLDN